MSPEKWKKRTLDALSAACRHLQDAQHLAQPGAEQSLDQAYHLAGFAPECARKACLQERWADKAIGHGVGEVGEEVLEFLTALDLHAHRYRPHGWASRFPALAEWNVNCRYERTGTYQEAKVSALLTEANDAVFEVLTAMWADGRVPVEEVI